MTKRVRNSLMICSLSLLAATGLMVHSVAPAQAQESGIETFATHNPNSNQAIDYQPLDTFYEAFGREEDGRLNLFYEGMDPQGVEFIDAFLSALSTISPTVLNRDEQLAYWLNIRNLMIISAIASDDPGRSLEDERGTFAEPGEMWTQKLVTIDGVTLSIDDIERDIILRNFSDNPYVLYGLYQGVQGGPPLMAMGFRGGMIREDLRGMAEKYLNGRRVVRVRRDEANVPLPLIWYKDILFGGDDARIIAHLKDVAGEDLLEDLADAQEVDDQDFSYRLDEFEIRQQRQRVVGPSGIPGGGFPGGGGGGGGS